MPRYKVIVEKKDLLSIIVDRENVQDAMTFVAALMSNKLPNKENTYFIEDVKITETPLTVSIVGAPELEEYKKKDFVIETKGN